MEDEVVTLVLFLYQIGPELGVTSELQSSLKGLDDQNGKPLESSLSLHIVFFRVIIEVKVIF